MTKKSIKEKSIKERIVYQCSNKSNEGKFVGKICGPCYLFIRSGVSTDNTVFRNAIAIAVDRLKKIFRNLSINL